MRATQISFWSQRQLAINRSQSVFRRLERARRLQNSQTSPLLHIQRTQMWRRKEDKEQRGRRERAGLLFFCFCFFKIDGKMRSKVDGEWWVSGHRMHFLSWERKKKKTKRKRRFWHQRRQKRRLSCSKTKKGRFQNGTEQKTTCSSLCCFTPKATPDEKVKWFGKSVPTYSRVWCIQNSVSTAPVNQHGDCNRVLENTHLRLSLIIIRQIKKTQTQRTVVK